MKLATLDANFNSVIRWWKSGLLSQITQELHATNSDFVNNRISYHVDNGAVPGNVEGCNSYYNPFILLSVPCLLTLYYLLMQVNAQVQALPLRNTQHWQYLEFNHTPNTFTGLNNGIDARRSGWFGFFGTYGFYVWDNTFTDIQNYEPLCNGCMCGWRPAAASRKRCVFKLRPSASCCSNWKWPFHLPPPPIPQNWFHNMVTVLLLAIAIPELRQIPELSSKLVTLWPIWHTVLMLENAGLTKAFYKFTTIP